MIGKARCESDPRGDLTAEAGNYEALGKSMALLGAGASADAGVPTSYEMTRRIGEALAEQRHRFPQSVSAFNFVCGALIAHDSAAGASPFEGLDVERVFAAVELLAERQVLEVTPFVAAWDPAVDSWDQRRVANPPFVGKNLVDAITRASGDRSSSTSITVGNEIERILTGLIDARARTVSTGTTYVELAALMLHSLRTLVQPTPNDVQYLQPLINFAKNRGSLAVATLNYDRSIELAAAATGVDVTTGIDGWIKSGSWSWPQNGIRLLKLHGSIDWVWESQLREGSLPRRVVEVRTEPGENADPALIFGQRGKLRAEGPFLGLLAEFERELSCVTRLVVIGYSFRDDHVNEILRRWTAEDPTRTFLVVDPEWPADHDLLTPRPWAPGTAADFRSELRQFLIPPSYPGATQNFSPRLEVRRERCKDALERLYHPHAQAAADA